LCITNNLPLVASLLPAHSWQALYSFKQTFTNLFVLLLYSFWVPQIVLNVITEARKPLHLHYIVGMSITRVLLPLYLFGYNNNFVVVAFPGFKANYGLCVTLLFWVGIQASVLIMQMKWGTRFFIPAKFLPPKFDYSRPLPPSLLAQTNGGSSSSSSSSSNGVEADIEMGTIHSRAPTIAEVDPSPTSNNDGALDCVICYSPINPNDPGSYMLPPCEHIFHRECLVQWMEVKMECPTCRGHLPAV